MTSRVKELRRVWAVRKALMANLDRYYKSDRNSHAENMEYLAIEGWAANRVREINERFSNAT